jgi:hypothetical protein
MSEFNMLGAVFTYFDDEIYEGVYDAIGNRYLRCRNLRSGAIRDFRKELLLDENVRIHDRSEIIPFMSCG